MLPCGQLFYDNHSVQVWIHRLPWSYELKHKNSSMSSKETHFSFKWTPFDSGIEALSAARSQTTMNTPGTTASLSMSTTASTTRSEMRIMRSESVENTKKTLSHNMLSLQKNLFPRLWCQGATKTRLKTARIVASPRTHKPIELIFVCQTWGPYQPKFVFFSNPQTTTN